MINEPLSLMLAWVTGMLLGALFFGGLWWTIRKSIASKRPAFWFVGSLLLRISIAVTGFYLVSGGHWQRLLVCLLGFVMARVVVTRLTRTSEERQSRPTQEASHAS